LSWKELSGEKLFGKNFPRSQSVILYPLSFNWSIGLHTNLVGLLFSVCHFFWITLLRRWTNYATDQKRSFSSSQRFFVRKIIDLHLVYLHLKKYFQNSIKNTFKEQNDLILLALCEEFNVVLYIISLTLTFHQNTTYVICEVRWRFNNVCQCTFLDETSKKFV
jgi:hypothetical protein